MLELMLMRKRPKMNFGNVGGFQEHKLQIFELGEGGNVELSNVVVREIEISEIFKFHDSIEHRGRER